VPETTHIAAYPHESAIPSGSTTSIDSPANRHILREVSNPYQLIAMQKVEGSNPFSRFPKSRSRAGFRRSGLGGDRLAHRAEISLKAS
jgi:hypothetical protein